MLAVAITGVASAQSVDSTPGAIANRHAARKEASKLLAGLHVPAGATAVSGDPSAGRHLGSASLVGASAELVDLHRFWRVSASPAEVLEWFQAHRPAGTTVAGTGVASGPGYSVSSIAFWLPPVKNVLLSRELGVSIAAARGGDAAIRVDAQVVWYLPRPKWERVPAGSTQVDVTVTRTDVKTGQQSSSSQTVTAAATVGKIVSLVDRLPMDQLGPVPCPVDLGPDATLEFLSASGASLATATAQGEGCGLVSFAIRGRSEPQLADGGELVERLGKLLGFRTVFPRPVGDVTDRR